MAKKLFYEGCPTPQSFVVKISGGMTSWRLLSKQTFQRSGSKRGKKSNCTFKVRKQSKLEKARKRSVSSLATVFARLLIPPSGFMTLAFDWDAYDYWRLEDCLACFKRFRRYLERSYPKCWFIFVMEWSPVNGFHFHLSGRLGKKISSFKKIRAKWLAITGSLYHGAIHFQSYNPILHRSYVTKKKIKAARTRQLMEMLDGRSFWGCIHRKRIPLAPIDEYILDEDQMAGYRFELETQIVKHNGAQSSLDRLRTDANRLCFNTPEMLEQALKFAQEFDPDGGLL